MTALLRKLNLQLCCLTACMRHVAVCFAPAIGVCSSLQQASACIIVHSCLHRRGTRETSMVLGFGLVTAQAAALASAALHCAAVPVTHTYTLY